MLMDSSMRILQQNAASVISIGNAIHTIHARIATPNFQDLIAIQVHRMVNFIDSNRKPFRIHWYSKLALFNGVIRPC